MLFHQKNNICMYNPKILLLPITDALFVEKPVPIKSSEENTLDFHLDMIKKIDSLLQKHDKETPIDETTPLEAAPTVPQQVPVEVRPPLERRPGHVEPEPPHMQEISFPKSGILPEEFKTDPALDIEPEFKFITRLDSRESILHLRPQHHDRIEVIDLSEFITDDIPSHLNTPIIIADSHIRQKLQIKKQANDNIQHFAVHDPRLLNQKEYQKVFLSAATQNEEIEKKEKVYYHTDSKTKKNNFDNIYIPDNFEERLKSLQKKLQQEQENSQKQSEKETQQKQGSEEKQKKQLEKEEQWRRKLEEKLKKQIEKGEQKKHKLEEKIKIRLEREQEKLLKHEFKGVNSKGKKSDEEKKELKKEAPSLSVAFTKKQFKKQQRLESLAARQEIFEERLKIKKDKRLLKEQKKHLELMKSDTIEKYTPEPMELDTDIKKILQITDELLGELPEEVINRFMRTDEYDLYERILNKYKIR